jgi:CheY-like chemotaxis protein
MKILIADDYRMMRELIRDYLQSYFPKAEIQSVTDGKEIIDTVLQDPYWDMIISDILMPHITGIDAAAYLCHHHIKIPFIFVSASHEHYLKRLPYTTTFFVAKENICDDLYNAVKEVVEQNHLQIPTITSSVPNKAA